MAAARHRGRHRKARGARQANPAVRDEERRLEGRVGTQRDRSRSGGTAVCSMRSYLMAGVALVGASVIAVTPVAAATTTRDPRRQRGGASGRRLLPPQYSGEPVIDVINIPHAEIQAINMLARSQIFSGPWFVVSASNIWGVDPGDPAHFMAVVDLLAPFPALSGLYLDQNDQNGLGQQVWNLVAAELPVNAIATRRLHAQRCRRAPSPASGRSTHLVERGDTDRPGEISAFRQLFSGTTLGSGVRVHFWPRIPLATLTQAGQSIPDSASRVRPRTRRLANT